MRVVFSILSILFTLNSYAIDLKHLEKSKLLNSKICFYPGSFDPFHEGHDFVAQKSLDEFCDYILIYPSWGGDDYKLNRSSLAVRQNKLNEIYANHPKIILTKMAPKELYEYFKQKRDFIAIVGSDVAKWLMHDEKIAHEFATGIRPIANDTWGGCVSVHADSFVIFLRGNSTKKEFGRKLLNRNIIRVLESPKKIRNISSTKIRNANIH